MVYVRVLFRFGYFFFFLETPNNQILFCLDQLICNLKSVFLYICYYKNIHDLQSSSPVVDLKSETEVFILVPDTPYQEDKKSHYIPHPGGTTVVLEIPASQLTDEAFLEQILAVPTLAVRCIYIFMDTYF